MKSFPKTFALALILLAGFPLLGVSQTADQPPAASHDPAKSLDALFGELEHSVTGIAQAMPADKYDFAPAQNMFTIQTEYRGVRTFAQQVAHIAAYNYIFLSGLSADAPTVDEPTLAKLKTKAELLQALRDSYAYAHKAIATITPANAFDTVVSDGQKMTRVDAVAFCMAHGMDHQGQMVEYLRMNSIVPPGSAVPPAK